MSGNVQAARVEPPFSLIARRMGFRTLVNLRESDYEAPSYGVVTTRAYIASNEEVVRRFLRATVAGLSAVVSAATAAFGGSSGSVNFR